MTEDARPIVVAFDGSAESQAAARAAASLFRDRLVLVVSVWEPGLAMAVMSSPDATGLSYPPPTPEQIEAVDRAQQDHAASMAQAGARLVEELGGTAEALPVADSLAVAEAVIAIAAASRRMLHDTHRPVLVVRAPE